MTFDLSNNTEKRLKQATEWETIFKIYIVDKALVSWWNIKFLKISKKAIYLN